MTRRCTELNQVRVVSRTAHWLPDTDEFKAWESQALRVSPLPLLVIDGKAGSGKSIIMHTTFVHARSHASPGKDIYILYCFDASNGSPLQNSQQGLYRSILCQILDQIAPSVITAHYVRGWNENKSAHQDIVTLKDRIIRLLSQSGAEIVNIYVDALDECVGEDKDKASAALEILEFLKTMGETGAPLISNANRS
ncbi:nacht and ankyrin domain protein [Ilyonectria robusta]